MTYIKRSKDSSFKYHQNNVKKTSKKIKKTAKLACKTYQSLSKEEKEKKQQYGYKRYKNLPEDVKKRVEYSKKIP